MHVYLQDDVPYVTIEPAGQEVMDEMDLKYLDIEGSEGSDEGEGGENEEDELEKRSFQNFVRNTAEKQQNAENKGSSSKNS